MSSTNVVSICQPPRTFTLQEANDLIPLFERITARHESVVVQLLDKQRYLVKTGATADTYNKIDPLVGKEMVQWGAKLVKLGAQVFTHGYIGFDAGNGFYWSWHFGEKSITYFHGHSESPLQRIPILVSK